MDVQNIKTLVIMFKPIFLNMFFVFGFIRILIGKQIELSERLAKIEGRCQERHKEEEEEIPDESGDE